MRNPFARMHQAFNDLFAWIESKQPGFVDVDEPVGQSFNVADQFSGGAVWAISSSQTPGAYPLFDPTVPVPVLPWHVVTDDGDGTLSARDIPDGVDNGPGRPTWFTIHSEDSGATAYVTDEALDQQGVMAIWLAWALPAIYDVLAEHPSPTQGDECECPKCGERIYDNREWREHVGPIIAARIACDPRRAMLALQTLL